jgi:gluconate 5-dehydrogenase
MVIVTGSTGGIGSVIAKAFGGDVFGIDRHNCDLRDENSIRSVLKDVSNVKTLINCAGVSNGSWDETLDVNLTAPYVISTLVAKKMPWGGSIINITSLNAHLGFPGNPGYVASKAGLLGLTRALAVDFAPRIRVNAVCPGYIHTGMTEKSYWNPTEFQKRNDRTMLGRWGDPDDIVGAVKFLASYEARYITGQEIVVDGGWLAKGL